MKRLFCAVLALLLLQTVDAPPALAYVGPGAGLTLVGSFLGLCLAVLVALGAVLSWPIRRMLKLRREKTPPTEGEPHGG